MRADEIGQILFWIGQARMKLISPEARRALGQDDLMLADSSRIAAELARVEGLIADWLIGVDDDEKLVEAAQYVLRSQRRKSDAG